MYEIPLINAVLEWDRRLEIENNRRKAYRFEPYRELPVDIEPNRKKRASILEWISRLSRDRKSVYPYCTQEQNQETQPG
jgi:hypothetical protein